MKKIENSEEWVHVTCGLFSEGLLTIDSYKTMSFSKPKDTKFPEKEKKSKINCSICKSNVAVKKCIDESCTEHAHIYCTMKFISEIG
jgi:PHD-zinc-finger like domain